MAAEAEYSLEFYEEESTAAKESQKLSFEDSHLLQSNDEPLLLQSASSPGLDAALRTTALEDGSLARSASQPAVDDEARRAAVDYDDARRAAADESPASPRTLLRMSKARASSAGRRTDTKAPSKPRWGTNTYREPPPRYPAFVRKKKFSDARRDGDDDDDDVVARMERREERRQQTIHKLREEKLARETAPRRRRRGGMMPVDRTKRKHSPPPRPTKREAAVGIARGDDVLKRSEKWDFARQRKVHKKRSAKVRAFARSSPLTAVVGAPRDGHARGQGVEGQDGAPAQGRGLRGDEEEVHRQAEDHRRRVPARARPGVGNTRRAGGEPRRRRRAAPPEASRAPSTPARDAAPGAIGSPWESPRDPRPTRADPRPTRARRHNSRLHGKHLKRLNKHRMRTVNTPSPCDGYPDIYCCDPHLPRWNFGDTYDRHMVKKWDVEWGGRRHYAANDCFERPNVKRASMVI